MTDTIARPVTLTPATLRDQLLQETSLHGGYLIPFMEACSNYRAVILEEAHYLNDEFDAYRQNDVSLSGTFGATPQADSIIEKAEAHGYHATDEERAKLRKLITDKKAAEDQLALALSTINALRFDQIKGNDSRLREFWDKAQENAVRENYCSEYDRMAELLDGPRRMTSGQAGVTVTVTVWIDVDDINDVDYDENAVDELVRDYLGSNNADNYNFTGETVTS